MRKSVIFFGLSDHVNHPLRNYKKFAGIKEELNIPYGNEFGSYNALDVYYPSSGAQGLPVVVNIHGGGFVRGDKRYRSGLCRYFCSNGYVVINVNYRLAPEYCYPAPVEDVVNALNFISGNLYEKYGYDKDRIIVTGDSAGGYYAAAGVTATVNDEYRKALGLPEYIGAKIASLLTFCAPFDLCKCFTAKTPLGISMDVANCVFGTDYKENRIPEDFKYYNEINLLNYINEAYPECFVMHAINDGFCGGQAEGFKNKLTENGIYFYEYAAKEKGDGHCTFLFPFKSGSKKCYTVITEYLNNFKIRHKNINKKGE